MEKILRIEKRAVLDEVSQTADYTGAKLQDSPNGDAKAYERIMTTEADGEKLERFWREACVYFCDEMKRFLKNDRALRDAETGEVTGHEFVLELGRSFDEALWPSIEKESQSYFVMYLSSKWFVFTNKSEAEGYAASAASLLEGVHRKACYKKKPTRPSY